MFDDNNYMKGLIYKITNTENNKIYIGKTKEYYGEKKFGIKGRLGHHLTNAFTPSKRNDCPRFYNAIRKYGKSSFQIELLETCDMDIIDETETGYISKYNSTDRKIGYNIAKGGGGRSVVMVDEDVRKKISQSNNSSNKLLNIKEIYDDGKLIGYTVRRRISGKQYQKWFTSTTNTPDENLKLAKAYLEEIKSGRHTSNDYNKTSTLPRNINYVKENGDIIGYRVDIMINGKKTTRSFQSPNMTLDEKYKKAIEIKDKILKKES